ncbi:MAG: alpha/beta hydrolase [Candidatus Wallbacteria bacterium]|nr:alpha/beta hydrolase [Candidatus Wallbacteria bacterium]
MPHTPIRLANAPALLVSRDANETAGRRGTILFYHGFTAQKESNLKELESLAAAGWLAVGIDNAGHGERRYPDFDRRFKADPRTVGKNFYEVVRDTAREAPKVVDALMAHGLADPAHLGIAGISMGGYITYGAVLLDRRLRAAAPILGSPRWNRSAEDSPHLAPDRFFPLALLSQTAGDDENVPPHHARQLHEALSTHYASAPSRQRYIEYAGARHFMPAGDWERLWSRVLEWFGEYL